VVEPQPQSEEVRVEERPKSVSLLGGSLTSLLDKVSNQAEVEGKSVRITIDPASESKLTQAKEAIVQRMCSERPRFISAFELVEFEGNTVKLSVPSEALRDELLGQRYEILTAMAALAGVKGSLDMLIEVREMEFKLKPIKLEDRIAHIQKVMPELVYMQKALDMDFE
jgi:DNA polymerase-3 subunit gamma/tau